MKRIMTYSRADVRRISRIIAAGEKMNKLHDLNLVELRARKRALL